MLQRRSCLTNMLHPGHKVLQLYNLSSKSDNSPFYLMCAT